MATTFEKFFDEAARFTREPRSAEEYLAKSTEHLEELNSFDASSRLCFMREAMAYVVKYQQVALDMCRHTIFFKRKELRASIYDVRRQILEKAKSYVEMYDTTFSETKSMWERFSKPDYVKTSERNPQVNEENYNKFNSFIQNLSNTFGKWIYDERFAHDPPSFLAGDGCDTISIRQMLEYRDLNYNVYPQHEEWAGSIPYGAYLLELWLPLMSSFEEGGIPGWLMRRRHPEIPFYGEFFHELISSVEALDTVSNG